MGNPKGYLGHVLAGASDQEKEKILGPMRTALRDSGWNMTKAAQMVGIPKRTFIRLAHKFGIWKAKRGETMMFVAVDLSDVGAVEQVGPGAGNTLLVSETLFDLGHALEAQAPGSPERVRVFWRKGEKWGPILFGEKNKEAFWLGVAKAQKEGKGKATDF